MKFPPADRWIEPVVALAAALSVGVGWSVTLWSAGAPWVPPVYQDVFVEASDLGLGVIVVYALVAGRKSANCKLSRLGKTETVAGGILLVFLALSALRAIAPLLSLATIVHVGLGLLAYRVVAQRPRLARWLVIGFSCLILLELPIIALQETSQARYPLVMLLGSGGNPYPASDAGAAVVFGPGGARWQRAMGTFPHPNVLGGFVAMSLVLALPLRNRPSPRWNVLWLSFWTIGWIELVFSFSRAGLLGALVGCGIWLLSRRAQTRGGLDLARVLFPPVVALVSAALVAGSFLLPRIEPTPAMLETTPVSGRLLLGSVAGAFILAHPLFGVGAGNFSLAELAPPFNAVAVDPVHVVPLLVAAEAGVFAGLAWLIFVVGGPLAHCWRRRFHARSRARLALPLAVLTLALLDHYLWTLGAGRAAFWLGLAIWAAETREIEDAVAVGRAVLAGSRRESIAR